LGLVRFTEGIARVLRDKALAEAKLPANTRYVNARGVRGWLYGVTSAVGDPYKFFLWFDGASYQVRLLEPDVDSRLDPHACHLLRDGRLCLSPVPGAGVDTLEEAYARSVVWCNGFSVFLREERFPDPPAIAGAIAARRT
jgi:hypothetical protein